MLNGFLMVPLTGQNSRLFLVSLFVWICEFNLWKMEESQEKTTEKAGWHKDNVKEYSKEFIPVPVPVKIIFLK